MSKTVLQLVTKLKHMAGKHNQQAHAGKGKAGGAVNDPHTSDVPKPKGMSDDKWVAVKGAMREGEEMEESMLNGMTEAFGYDTSVAILSGASDVNKTGHDQIKAMLAYNYEGLQGKPPAVGSFINHMKNMMRDMDE